MSASTLSTLALKASIGTDHLARSEIGNILKQLPRFERLEGLVEVSQILPAGRHVSSAIAELELKDVLLDLPRRNGPEAYLDRLPKDGSRAATIGLAQLLESIIPEEDNREKLLRGLIATSDVPGLDEGIKQLMDRCPVDRMSTNDSEELEAICKHVRSLTGN